MMRGKTISSLLNGKGKKLTEEEIYEAKNKSNSQKQKISAAKDELKRRGLPNTRDNIYGLASGKKIN